MKYQHLSCLGLIATASSQQLGYDCHPTCIASTIPSNETINFGQHYAVLHLDLLNLFLESIENSTVGKAFINNVASWIDAVHAQDPVPLTFFTRLYFSNSHKPELGPNAPIAAVASAVGTAASPETHIYPAFKVDKQAGDVVLQKTRYYAGAGNALELILNTQKIDTVILSGIRTSGVILATALRLFDLDYHVYVIANNTLETPPNGPEVNKAILEGILPKEPINVITIEQAMEGLKNSGPAIY